MGKIDKTDLLKEVKVVADAWLAKREQVITWLCHHVVVPKMRGELTAKKIKDRGLVIAEHMQGHVFWLEQRGLRVSPVFDMRSWRVSKEIEGEAGGDDAEEIVRQAMAKEAEEGAPMINVRVGGQMQKQRIGKRLGRVKGKQAPVINMVPEQGNNDLCTCNSGKKFKKCCKNKTDES